MAKPGAIEDTLIGLVIAAIGQFVVLLPIGTFYLLVSNSTLKNRLATVETQVAQLKVCAQDAVVFAPSDEQVAQGLSTTDQRVSVAQNSASKAEPTADNMPEPQAVVPQLTSVETPFAPNKSRQKASCLIVLSAG